jgi:hypothetical protein
MNTTGKSRSRDHILTNLLRGIGETIPYPKETGRVAPLGLQALYRKHRKWLVTGVLSPVLLRALLESRALPASAAASMPRISSIDGTTLEV